MNQGKSTIDELISQMARLLVKLPPSQAERVTKAMEDLSRNNSRQVDDLESIVDQLSNMTLDRMARVLEQVPVRKAARAAKGLEDLLPNRQPLSTAKGGAPALRSAPQLQKPAPDVRKLDFGSALRRLLHG